MLSKFRTGDIIHHKPTGETWLVAWADEAQVISCGAPERIVLPEDCIVEERCEDQEHWSLVAMLARQQWSVRGLECRRYMERSRHMEAVRF